MQQKVSTWGIMFLFGLSIAALFVSEQWCNATTGREDSVQMQSAVHLASQWFAIVKEQKQARGIVSDGQSVSPYSFMLGDEYTEITTTLGSIEAKTTSANPEFAAVLVQMLDDAEINSSSMVGVSVSGSFPSLSIATLAALQTLGAKVILQSSLGASSYGANQVQATWIDIEGWLREYGGLQYQSQLVTFGAEDDSGGGIQEEGLLAIREAVKKNNTELYFPHSFEESVERRMQMFKENHINLFINIGGNQTSLGSCTHSTTIPNGYHNALRSCMDSGRGILMRLSELNIPVIHLLNIRDLAFRYGLPLIPDGNASKNIYVRQDVKKFPVAVMVFALLAFMVGINRYSRNAKVL